MLTAIGSSYSGKNVYSNNQSFKGMEPVRSLVKAVSTPIEGYKSLPPKTFVDIRNAIYSLTGSDIFTPHKPNMVREQILTDGVTILDRLFPDLKKIAKTGDYSIFDSTIYIPEVAPKGLKYPDEFVKQELALQR